MVTNYSNHIYTCYGNDKRMPSFKEHLTSKRCMSS